jgi:hypothetical protein
VLVRSSLYSPGKNAWNPLGLIQLVSAMGVVLCLARASEVHHCISRYSSLVLLWVWMLFYG